MKEQEYAGENDEDVKKNVKKTPLNPYSCKYRVLKTVLMCLAWLSFGINQELARVTFEDLRILLDTNYEGISLVILMRFIGAMGIVLFVGFLMDKFIKYSEILMAIGKFFMATPNLIIPHVRIYWLAVPLFLIQGIGIGMYDIGGNQIILRLWSGISNSPVNAMQAGYGIGAIFVVQVFRFYIKSSQLAENQSLNVTFDFNNQSNYTAAKRLTSKDIDLVVPYTVGGLFGIILVIAFLIAQYFETKALKKHAQKQQQQQQEDQSQPLNESSNTQPELKCGSIQKVIFGKIYHDASTFSIVLVVTILIFLLFMFVFGSLTIINTFMRTYLTKGPGKFMASNFITLQTLYWTFFIIGRLLAAFLGFKMNSLYFFLTLISLELCFMIIYSIPYFNSIQILYWIFIPTLGILFGPLIPSCYMIPKHIFQNVNTFLLSIFYIGAGCGNMISQYLTGFVLDRFIPEDDWLNYSYPSSIYAIPFILLSFVLTLTAIFLTIFTLFKRFKSKFH